MRKRPYYPVVAGLAIAAAVGWLLMSGPRERQNEGRSRPAAGVPVLLQNAETQPFPIIRRTIGTLESPAIVVIRSRIDSQLLEANVSDGQIVKKGQLLFTLDDRELRAAIARDRAVLAKDAAALTQAESNLKRSQQLAAKGFTPEQQLEEAQAAFKAAQQTVEADRALVEADELRLGYATIEAPMAGRLGAIRTVPGNLVSSGDVNGIATLTQIRPLRVSFSLAERDLPALRAGMRRQPPLAVRIFTGGTEPAASGTLDFVDSSVDPSSGTIAARATIPNQKFELWPGQYVDVEIELGSVPSAILLPSSAVLMGQKGPYVFVAKTDATVEVRPVVVGGVLGDRSAIVSGLVQGDRVVTEGQSRLNAGTRYVEAAPQGSVSGAETPKAGIGRKGASQ